MKKKNFINQIKLSAKYEYKRPHTSRDIPNKYAFMKLTISQGSIDNMADNNNLSLEELAFFDKIKEIDKIVPKQIYPALKE